MGVKYKLTPTPRQGAHSPTISGYNPLNTNILYYPRFWGGYVNNPHILPIIKVMLMPLQ
jgi:hypothetical protein